MAGVFTATEAAAVAERLLRLAPEKVALLSQFLEALEAGEAPRDAAPVEEPRTVAPVGALARTLSFDRPPTLLRPATLSDGARLG